LIDRHIIQCYHKKEEEEVFAQMGEEPISPRPKPLVIHFTKSSSIPPGQQPFVIQTPSPFPYKSEKTVPWKYGVNVLRGEEKGEEKIRTLITMRLSATSPV